MKYNVGDRVLIKSLDWYNENKDEDGIVELSTHIFTPGMSQFCGKVMTIEDVFEDIDDNGVYYMEEIDYNWIDEMIEGLVEEEVGLVDNFSSRWVNEFNLPDGYIFKDENGNVINATKIVLEKKKKEYPKTYEECCKVLNIAVCDLDILDNMLDTTELIYRKNLDRLLNSFRKLLICRDAYWKIAGEEMGLGKPWENGRCEVVYSICRDYDDIVKQDDYWGGAHIFEFPIREMRDAFKKNFDTDIEICKEFL